MKKSRLDRWLAPWVFVFTGILFNILSAVITHYFIGLNNEQINAIEREVHNRQVLIDSLWQSRIEVERKEEFFLLWLQQPNEISLTRDYYREYLRGLVETHDLDGFGDRALRASTADLPLLLEISDAAQKTIIETINTSYFEVLELQEGKMPLEAANSRLFSIAIFLQVTGLILVLARDLRRN